MALRNGRGTKNGRAGRNGRGSGETLLIRSRRMMVPDGEQEAAAFVRDHRIEVVGDYDLRLDADRTVDLGDLPLLPGLRMRDAALAAHGAAPMGDLTGALELSR